MTLTLYHWSPQQLDELPPDSQLIDDPDYCESVGRLLSRTAGSKCCFVHTVRVEHEDVTYTGRESLGESNTYRLKRATPVESVRSLEC